MQGAVLTNDLPDTGVSGGTLVATLDPNSVGVAVTGPGAPASPVTPASTVFTNFGSAGTFTFVPLGSDTGGWTYVVPYGILYTPTSGPATTATAFIRVTTGAASVAVALPLAVDDSYSLTKGFTFSGESLMFLHFFPPEF